MSKNTGSLQHKAHQTHLLSCTDNRKLDPHYFHVNGSRIKSIIGKTDRLQRYKAQREAEIKTKPLTVTTRRKVSLDGSLILRLLIL